MQVMPGRGVDGVSRVLKNTGRVFLEGTTFVFLGFKGKHKGTTSQLKIRVCHGLSVLSVPPSLKP